MIGPHSIHVQERHDPERQWFPTPYKLSDEELEVIIDDWPTPWRDPISLEEVSMSPLLDALVDPVLVTNP